MSGAGRTYSLPNFKRKHNLQQKDINSLVKRGVIEIQQSGFKGHSSLHSKIVIVKDAEALEAIRGPFEGELGRREGMEQQYPVQVNFKIGFGTKYFLDMVAEFEDIKPSEFIRHWVREKLAEYRKDRLFLRWFEKREKRQEEQRGVDLSKGHKRKREDEESER